MSDVEHAGWAVGGPGSQLRRRRNPLLGLLALVLIAGGTVAAIVGIVRLAGEAGPSDERIVATGTVAALGAAPGAPAVRFMTGRAERLTIWLRAGGVSNVRDTVVAGTACRIVRANESTALIRGSRQGTSVQTDSWATIGETTSTEGTNAIACAHVPFGRAGRRGALMEQRPFVVELGSPGDGLRGLWLLFPGIAAALLGIAVAIRWRAGSLRPA